MYQTVDAIPSTSSTGPVTNRPSQRRSRRVDQTEVDEQDEHRPEHPNSNMLPSGHRSTAIPRIATAVTSSTVAEPGRGCGPMPAALRARTGTASKVSYAGRWPLGGAAGGAVTDEDRLARACSGLPPEPGRARRGTGIREHRQGEHGHRGVQRDVRVVGQVLVHRLSFVASCRAATTSSSSSGMPSSSSLARPPTDTSVRPASGAGDTRTKTRRRRMTSEQISPASARMAEARVSHLPGSCRIERPANRSPRRS